MNTSTLTPAQIDDCIAAALAHHADLYVADERVGEEFAERFDMVGTDESEYNVAEIVNWLAEDVEPLLSTPAKQLTMRAVIDELAAMKEPMTIRKTPYDEYRVTFKYFDRASAEAVAHYTNDLEDALNTARHMQTHHLTLEA